MHLNKNYVDVLHKMCNRTDLSGSGNWHCNEKKMEFSYKCEFIGYIRKGWGANILVGRRATLMPVTQDLKAIKCVCK